jgi:hypothetical protein
MTFLLVFPLGFKEFYLMYWYYFGFFHHVFLNGFFERLSYYLFFPTGVLKDIIYDTLIFDQIALDYVFESTKGSINIENYIYHGCSYFSHWVSKEFCIVYQCTLDFSHRVFPKIQDYDSRISTVLT